MISFCKIELYTFENGNVGITRVGITIPFGFRKKMIKTRSEKH